MCRSLWLEIALVAQETKKVIRCMGSPAGMGDNQASETLGRAGLRPGLRMAAWTASCCAWCDIDHIRWRKLAKAQVHHMPNSCLKFSKYFMSTVVKIWLIYMLHTTSQMLQRAIVLQGSGSYEQPLTSICLLTFAMYEMLRTGLGGLSF